ncbi:hypothetical protein ACSBR1_018374 [Camellia fascicularis]
MLYSHMTMNEEAMVADLDLSKLDENGVTLACTGVGTEHFKAILESFTHRPCDLGKLNEVQVQLRDTLAEKKFLLVLDDVWHYGHDGWNSLRLPFGAGVPGSKIIVTTREGGVVKQMGMDEYLNLKNLSYDDCWLIFAQHAFENRNIMECSELVSMGKKIVENRCRGLPLAARALGSLLCCKQEHEWKEILNSDIWNEESGILTALKLSYLHLPVHLKRCFSYCAIIPKDYEFMEEELVLLWMAEGLIEQPKGGNQMEDLGRKYFHELVSRSFFQPSSGNKSKFIMHDLINDLAQDVAGDKCFRLENNLEYGRHNKIFEKARHSSYVGSCYDGIKKFEVFDDAKCLRTFLQFLPQRFHFVTRCLTHDLLPKLKCLRELRLQCLSVDELPDSIGDLKHLRYLDVSGSRIRRLPDAVVTLYNLQVLFLKFCHQLQKLPLNMGRLVNLRHFDMTGVHIPSSEEMSLHIGKLINLQTLSNFMLMRMLETLHTNIEVSVGGAIAFVLIYAVYSFVVVENEILRKHVRRLKLDVTLLLPVKGSVFFQGNQEDDSIYTKVSNNERHVWGWIDDGRETEHSSFSYSKLCSTMELSLKVPCRLTIPLVKESWSKVSTLKVAYMLGVSIACAFGVLAFWYTRSHCPPQKFLLPLVLGGFLMSIVWFYMIANKLVALLVGLGVILGVVNPSILGSNLLAWGNSMGDLVSNVELAMNDGDGVQIALSRRYANLMFNTLIGLEISMLLRAWSEKRFFGLMGYSDPIGYYVESPLNKIHLPYLAAIVDIDHIDNYDWGGAALVTLYRYTSVVMRSCEMTIEGH